MSDPITLITDAELNDVKEPIEPVAPIVLVEEPVIQPVAPIACVESVKEPVIQPVVSSSDVVINLISLSSLLLANVKTPSYNLLPDQIEWINKFIEASPEVFDIILKDIIAITSDGKIDSHDIPLLIKLITDVYNSRAIARDMANSQNIIAFVKFTLEVILDSKYVVLPEIEKTIIKGLIDSSISLLSMNVASDKQRVLNAICAFLSKSTRCFSTK
jgi:hypothetical protein